MARSRASPWLILGILVFGVVLLAYGPQLADYFSQANIAQPSETISGEIVNKQLKIVVLDKYGGGTWSSGTVYIYDTSMNLLESGALDSSGTYTTALPYKSDTVLNVCVVDGNNKLWTKITVPRMSSADAETQIYNVITIKAFTLPSSLDLKIGFEGTVTNGSTNLTILGKTGTLDLYITRVAGYGFIPSQAYDFSTKAWKQWSAYAVITVPKGMVISGAIASYDVGDGTVKYLIPLAEPDVSAYSTETSLTVTKGIGFDASAVDSGSMKIEIYVYGDPSNFSLTDSLGSDAISLGSITVTLE